MNKSIIAIILSTLMATPTLANYCQPVEPPEEPPVVVTPVEPQDTTTKTDSEYSHHTPQYWTGTCELTTDGKVLVHTAASFLKLFNKEKAMKLAGEQCTERLKLKGILK